MNTEVFLLSKETNTFEGKDYAKLNVMLKTGKVGTIRCPLDLSVVGLEKTDCIITIDLSTSQGKIVPTAVGIAEA